MRIAMWALVLIATSALLAVGQNKFMWGYWLQRPTIASSLRTVDALLGISSLPPASPSEVFSNRLILKEARSRCEPPSNECLEGRLLLTLGGRESSVGEVRDVLLRQAWLTESVARPIPVPNDSMYHKSARPVEGVAIHFRQLGEEYIALAYRTSEVANDRYIYSEALYRLKGGNLESVRRERFFYEVAGLEVLEWHVFWVINFVVLAVCAPIATFIRRRIRKPSVSSNRGLA